MPLAVLMRPVWQELQPSLHIKTLPLFLIVKSVFQVYVTVLSKSLKRESRFSHAVVYLASLMLFTAFIMKSKPFNYERANLWLKGSMLGLNWSTSLLLVNEVSPIPNAVIMGICFGGWGVIILGCLVAQRTLPLLLVRQKMKDNSTLFKFAFTSGKGIDVANLRNTTI